MGLSRAGHGDGCTGLVVFATPGAIPKLCSLLPRNPVCAQVPAFDVFPIAHQKIKVQDGNGEDDQPCGVQLTSAFFRPQTSTAFRRSSSTP